MRVYGDRPRRTDPRAELEALREAVRAAGRLPEGLARHEALVAAMIAAGELAQGLADEAFERTGADGPSPAADLALRATRTLAEAVWASWRGGCASGPVDVSPLEALSAMSLPAEATLKEGEGYAFYALYPETYGEAAAAEPRPEAVVGLRSIGTSLAAVVAAASGAETLLTLRPVGPPFAREVRVGPVLGATPPGIDSNWAVVDEGPGLSGSTFAAALGWLEAQGVPPGGVQLYPSHPGEPGGEASTATLVRWRAAHRRQVAFEEAVLPRLPGWVEHLTGPAVAPLQDLSGGAWRALRYGDEAAWPASNTMQERRKFRLRSASGEFLLKFAGLGRIGSRKLARAQALAEAGFAPPPLGLRHGFLVERWVEATVIDGPPPEQVAAYLAFRAAAFSAAPEEGASLETLLEMAEVNVDEALGAEVAGMLECWRPRLAVLSARVRRVVTDNRLHRQEWLRDRLGRWLKTDALDHAEAHDLVGAQDIAWDVAGATVELGMNRDALSTAVGADAELTRFCELAYCAFQLGACAMAADAHAGWPQEASRLAAARDSYAARLRRSLA